MNNIKYIALDTETGGIPSNTSLLSIYLEVLDKDFNILDSLSLFTCPNDRIYQVTAEALTINGIDLKAHDKQAITYSEAGQVVLEFIFRNSDGGKNKLIPIGHNVYFDLEKVYDNLFSKARGQQYISYRLLDTGVIAQYLKTIGKMPQTISGSLKSLCEHYGIPYEKSHTAEGDTKLTIAVLRKMIQS